MRSFRASLALFISHLVLEETERNLSRKAESARPAYQLLRGALSENLVDPNELLVLETAATVKATEALIIAAELWSGQILWNSSRVTPSARFNLDCLEFHKLSARKPRHDTDLHAELAAGNLSPVLGEELNHYIDRVPAILLVRTCLVTPTRSRTLAY